MQVPLLDSKFLEGKGCILSAWSIKECRMIEMRLFPPPFWAFCCQHMCLPCFGIGSYCTSILMVWVSNLGPLFNFAQLPKFHVVLSTHPFPTLHYLVLLDFSYVFHNFHQYFILVMFRIWKPRFLYWVKVNINCWTTKWEKLRRDWIFGFFFCLYKPNS